MSGAPALVTPIWTALAVAVAFVPRRRDLRQLAALGAAVLIAVQLAAVHWFYFYIVWFTPLALAAILGAYTSDAARKDGAGVTHLSRSG